MTCSGATGSELGTGCWAAALVLPPLGAVVLDVEDFDAAGFDGAGLAAVRELPLDFAVADVLRLAGFAAADDVLDEAGDALADAAGRALVALVDDLAALFAAGLAVLLAAALFAVLFAVLPAGSALSEVLFPDDDDAADEEPDVRLLTTRSTCLASESTRLVSLSTSACRAVVLS